MSDTAPSVVQIIQDSALSDERKQDLLNYCAAHDEGAATDHVAHILADDMDARSRVLMSFDEQIVRLEEEQRVTQRNIAQDFEEKFVEAGRLDTVGREQLWNQYDAAVRASQEALRSALLELAKKSYLDAASFA
jgi:hypothetical protein